MGTWLVYSYFSVVVVFFLGMVMDKKPSYSKKSEKCLADFSKICYSVQKRLVSVVRGGM